MHQPPSSESPSSGVDADRIVFGLRRDAQLAKSFGAYQRRRGAARSSAIDAADGYRWWCQTACEAFIHREFETTVDGDSFEQRWRLMAYGADLREPDYRSRKRGELALVLVAATIIALVLTASVGLAAALAVCTTAVFAIARARSRGGTPALVVGPDASVKAQMRALWHWENSDFL